MQPEHIFEKNPRLLNKRDLARIYELLSTPLFRYAVRLLGDADLAEDCVAETFNRFLNAIQRGFGPSDNVRAYLYRIAHNWITDHYRRREQEETQQSLQTDGSSESPAVMESADWESRRVRQALLQLPEIQRQVLVLRFFEEWSHGEIAAATGKTVEATRALQYRAINGLRDLLVVVEERDR
jgi:RNA polymerase sigma-70 factor (ECF subfamily)